MKTEEHCALQHVVGISVQAEGDPEPLKDVHPVLRSDPGNAAVICDALEAQHLSCTSSRRQEVSKSQRADGT